MTTKYTDKQIAMAKLGDLYLKIKFPSVNTDLFLLENDDVAIKPSFNPFKTFDEFKDFYEKNCRPMCWKSYLTENIPTKYVKKIEPIDSKNLYNPASLFLTTGDFKEVLLAKFPKIKRFKHIKEDGTTMNIMCMVDKSTNEIELKAKILNFISTFKLPLIVNIEISSETEIKVEGKKKIDSLDVGKFYSYQTIKNITGKTLEYIKNDDTYYFDNIKRIYTGVLSKSDVLKHFGIDSKKSKVIVDCSVFSTINLRFLLTLYEEIYLIPPLKDNNFTNNFYSQNETDEKDILKLAEKGRIKFIIIQPENRLDTNLLEEAYKRNNESIISKRALQCITAAHLVELNKNYLFYQSTFSSRILKDSEKIYKYIANNNTDIRTKFSLKSILNLIEAPKRMLLIHLSNCYHSSILNYNICDIIKEQIYSINDKFDKGKWDSLSFELSINEEIANIAYVLDAFVAPRFMKNKISVYDSYPYVNTIYSHLSLFNSLDIRKFDYTNKDILKNTEFKNNKVVLQNLISIPNFCEVNISRGKLSLYDFDNILPQYAIKPFNKIAIDLLEKTEREREYLISVYIKKLNIILKKSETSENIYYKLATNLLGFIPNIGSVVSTISLTKDIATVIKETDINKEEFLLAKINKCIYLKK